MSLSLASVLTRLSSSGFRFASTLGLGRAALDSPCLRLLDMVSWDPFLVVRLGPGRHSRAISTGGWDAFVCGALFGCTTLCAITASAALLGEVGCDPDSVEKIDNANEAGKEEEVEEDASKR
jgi:hypothetical protein